MGATPKGKGERPAEEGPDPPWLLGASPARAALCTALERVSASDVSVLIQGESGSGKNLAARWLHAHSPRRAGALVEVDLSALAPTLVEAELFGHVAGAFTGAERGRTGRFVRAHGGTIVLDGVERLAEALQGKLLRTLQERVVEPLGAEAAEPIDVRVLSTSTGSLHERVRARKFREDLYYRLAVVELEVPPLRLRGADVLAIARGLIGRAAARAGVEPRQLTEGAAERLGRHAWPGNLRELENAIERVLVLAPAARAPIEAAELYFLDESVAGVPERLAREALAHGVTAERLESALFEAALKEARGNVTAAARLVGLTRRAFDLRHERHARGNGAADEARAEET